MQDNAIKRYLGILTGTALVLALIPLKAATGGEPGPGEIGKLIRQLASADRDLVSDTINRLKSVRSTDGINVILKSLGPASSPVRVKLFEILGAIGDPAVEIVFAASVPKPEIRQGRVPWASHVLTSHLKTDALPLLAMKVREGKASERKVAAWAIWSITCYHGVGKSDPAKLVSLLLEAASNDPVPYVRDYSAQALCTIQHDSSIPALIKLLSDKSDEAVARHACSGLSYRGAKAPKAIPVLKRGIEQGTLPAEAFGALIAIQGKEAVPFVVESLSKWKFGPNDRDIINMALAKHPHPVAIPFMQEELWKGNVSSRVRAARFFSALNHPATSLKEMRKCLRAFAKGKTERTPPTGNDVDCARRLRTIAARYFGDHGDAESYEAMLGMLKTDPSLEVRIAAAESLGKVRYEKAIPALQACFAVSDGRRVNSDRRHVKEMHTAAVQALANMQSEKAHRVLYEGAVEGQAKKQCIRFWRDAKDKTVFERFLEYSAKAPLDNKTAAGIIAAQLRTHHFHYAIPKKDLPDAKKRFLTSVQDPKHFGPGVDLSSNGKWKVSLGFTFYKNGFAKVSFDFRDPRGSLHGSGRTILYRKQGNSWILMLTVSGWTE